MVENDHFVHFQELPLFVGEKISSSQEMAFIAVVLTVLFANGLWHSVTSFSSGASSRSKNFEYDLKNR